jgi:A/G-specific adenine glycosylase
LPARIAPARRTALRRRLLAWWDAGHRRLPWRYPQRGADPYRVWLAEVMLQQTQVATALPYFERFVARWPTLEALARGDDGEVLALWGGLGYYARCRNLLAAAREALRRHGGLPASLEQLRALPGLGPYTAGAVASIAFAVPAAAVDGNVARVLARLFELGGDLSRPSARADLWALAAELVDAERPGDWNQALMELGATVCGRAAPACDRCPVAALCAARAAGRQRQLPPARRRPGRRHLVLACAVAERAGRVLLARRPPGGLFGGLLALPAVELAAGQEGAAALRDALRRQHSLTASIGPELGRAERVLTHRRLELRAYRCRVAPPFRRGGSLAWVSRSDLSTVGLPAAMRVLLGAAGLAIGGAETAGEGSRDGKRPRDREHP